jgi:putative DNA primase/helicase
MSVTVSKIPQELKDRNQWICWYTEMRDGKETKIPADPDTGSRASTTDPSTWSSLMNALKTFQTQDKMKGLGFVFTESDSYVGVDIDDCRDPETKEWEDWAIDVLQDLSGYREISPSGTGGHVIIKGEIPGDRNRRGNVEMYEKARYFTMTGDIVDEHGEPIDETVAVKEEQLGLDSVYNQFLAGDDDDANDIDVDVDLSEASLPERTEGLTTTGAGNIDVLPPEDQERLKKAKSATGNGLKFTNLWRGNWRKEYPGESHSEADMGFCDMLAFWFDKDPERMDRVFRASGLMRNKWDKKHYSDGTTYGERTIERAISKVDDVYDDDYYHNEVEQDSGDEDEDVSNISDASDPNSSEKAPNGTGTGNSDQQTDSESNNSTGRQRERTGSPLIQTESGGDDSDEQGVSQQLGEDETNADTTSEDEASEEARRGREDGQRVADPPSEFNPVGIDSASSSSTSSQSSEQKDRDADSGGSEEEEEEVFHGDFDLDTDGDEGNLKTGGDNSTRGATIDDRDDISEEETSSLFDADGDEDVRVDIDVEDIADEELRNESSETDSESDSDDSLDESKRDSSGQQEKSTNTTDRSVQDEVESQGGGGGAESKDGKELEGEEAEEDGGQSESSNSGSDGPEKFPWEKAKEAEKATEVFRQLRDYVTRLEDQQDTVKDELSGHLEVVNDKVNRTYHEFSGTAEQVDELSEENEKLRKQVEMQRQQINVLERVVFVLATEGNTELGHELGEAIRTSSNQDFDGVPTFRGGGNGILADLEDNGEGARSDENPSKAPNSASTSERTNESERLHQDDDALSGGREENEDSESSLLGGVSLSDVF